MEEIEWMARISNWLSDNWLPFAGLCVAFFSAGVSLRRYELAQIEKLKKESKNEEDKFASFKKHIYSRLDNLEIATSDNRSGIALIDDYSKKVRARVIKLDDKVSDCIALSNDASGYIRGKSGR